jgi:hypothetical protein
MNTAASLHVAYCVPIVIGLVLHLAYKAFRLRSITLIDIAFWLSCLFFGIGPIYVWFRASEFDYYSMDATGIFQTYANIYLFLIGLFIVQLISSRSMSLMSMDNETPKPTSKVAEVLLSASLVSPVYAMIGFAIAVLIRVVIATQYGMGIYASSTAERQAALPYFWVIMRSVGEILAMGCSTWAASMVWMRAKDGRWIARSIVILQALVFGAMMYRSLMLSFAIMLVMTYAIVKGRLLIRYLIGVSLMVYLMGAVIFPAFYSIRVHFIEQKSENTVERLMVAIERYREGRNDERIEAGYSRNLRTRPLIVQFNVAIFTAQEHTGWMNGRAMGSSILAVVPRALYLAGDKVYYSSEAFIGLTYFGSMADTSCNWPAVGAADFGVFGGLLYGVLFGAVLAGTQHIAWRMLHTHPLIAFCIVGAFMNAASHVEQTPEQTWGYCRDAALVYCFAVVLSYIFPTAKRGIWAEPLPDQQAGGLAP